MELRPTSDLAELHAGPGPQRQTHHDEQDPNAQLQAAVAEPLHAQTPQ